MEQTNKKNPLVSVIMPAYNASRFIEEAIRSVMAQTITDWELLVLDDGSGDDTLTIAQRLAREDSRIRVLPNEHNMGVAKTRNRGMDLCRGAYVAFLDSDDVWYPEKLEVQLDLMRETGTDLCYCAYAIVDAAGKKTRADYLVPPAVEIDGLLRQNVIGCSTVLLSPAIREKYRFETDFYHEDYVLWLQILQDGYKAVGCTRVLVAWRFVENSRSFNKWGAAKNRWRIYRDRMHLSFFHSVRLLVEYGLSGLRKYSKKYDIQPGEAYES